MPQPTPNPSEPAVRFLTMPTRLVTAASAGRSTRKVVSPLTAGRRATAAKTAAALGKRRPIYARPGFSRFMIAVHMGGSACDASP
jgi:hypothetical protein